MRRGTTPTVRIKLDADITAYECIMAITDEAGHTVTVSDDRITKEAAAASAVLTQEETLSLTGPRIYVQLRAYDESGTPATETQIMMDVLYDDIIGEVEG